MSEQINNLVSLVVIADDLTGALDAVAPLAATGKTVVVATDNAFFAEALERGADIVAVSTRSREIDGKLAHERVAEIVRQIPAGARIFKKVDSRLKGNIAAELAALPAGPLLVVPAIPEFNRFVRGGFVEGFGLAAPIEIRKLLGARGADANIPDVTISADFMEALRGLSEDTILVGARGLGVALAGGAPMQTERLSGRVAIAVGSTDPITVKQVEKLREAGVPICEAPDGKYRGPVPDARAVALLATSSAVRHDPFEVAGEFARSFREFSAGSDGIVLTGGATAEQVLDELGIGLLDVRGEVLPGLPLSLFGNLQIVTKSGGFGNPETLTQILPEQERTL